MSRINFLKLIIASPSEELAKCICFEPGLNVITSNRENGNDLGKSVIAKSLYHCMGADCIFDDKFDVNSKVFVLKFSFDSDLLILKYIRFFEAVDNSSYLMNGSIYFGPKPIDIHLQKSSTINLVLPFG